MAYPTAIGCGCLLGAGAASHLRAAEWSIQPLFGLSADYDSNRNLQQDVRGSEQGVLSADLQLTRAMENTQLMLRPHFDLRRFSNSVWGPGDDRSVTGAYLRSGERSHLNLEASYLDQNTLSTELVETGLVFTNTRRKLETATAQVDRSLSERRIFFTQMSYLASKYSGPVYIDRFLPGYRYITATMGERFIPSEHWTISGSGFGDVLLSDRVGGSSNEAGLQVEAVYTHSELYTFDLQVGESRRVLSEAVGVDFSGNFVFRGVSSFGTNISAIATRNLELGSVSVSYIRSLVPYGNGLLVQRQSLTATARRGLSPHLDADFSVTRIENNDATVRLRLDRRYYNGVTTGLNWRFAETWTLRSEAGASWAPPVGATNIVHEWRAALSVSWKPLALSMSR